MSLLDGHSLSEDSTHNEDRQFNFARGGEFEDFCVDALAKYRDFDLHIWPDRQHQWKIGESEEGFEVKLDQRCTNPGSDADEPRLSIEFYKQWANGKLGLSTTWRPHLNTRGLIIGNEQVIFAFNTQKLHDYLLDKPYAVYRPSAKFAIVRKFLPFSEAVKVAFDVLRFSSEIVRKYPYWGDSVVKLGEYLAIKALPPVKTLLKEFYTEGR